MQEYVADYSIGDEVLREVKLNSSGRVYLEKCKVEAIRVEQADAESYSVEYRLEGKRGWHGEDKLQPSLKPAEEHLEEKKDEGADAGS